MDGNLIAQAPGDGSAIMVQPFLPDQTPFIQMNEALIAQQKQRAADRKREDGLREAQKEAWIKEMKGNYKYDPADRPVVEREQKKLLDLIYKYDGSAKSKFAIEDAQLGIGKFINDSSGTYDQYLKKASDLSVNGDRVYFNNEDKLKASRSVNNAETLEDAFGVLGQRQANIEAFGQDQEKIKDVQTYIAKEVTKLQPVGYDPEQKPTEYGYVNVNVPKYDPEALKNLAGLLRKEKRTLREEYKTDEELYNAMLPYQKKTEKPTAKGFTSAQKNSGVSGGGTVTAGNVVFSPPQDYNYTDTGAQVKTYASYEKGMREAQRKAPTESQQLEIKNQTLSKEEYEKKFPYSSTVKAIPFSIKGLAENAAHQFTVVVDGKETQVDGQTNLYDATTNSFMVKTSGNKPSIVRAPVDKNKQFLTDAGLTVEDFNKAIEKVKGGNVVKTDNSGRVVSSEKENKGSLKQVYPQTKAEWDNAPKGSFYITKSGKKITK